MSKQTAATLALSTLFLGTLAVPANSALGSLGLDNNVQNSSEVIINGQQDGQETGASMVAMEDFNGDGWPDLAVGMPGWDDQDGLVAVYFGDGGPWTVTLDTASANLLFRGSPSSRGRAGEQLAVCDLNADGLSDLVMAAPDAGEGAGIVYVAQGSQTWGSEPQEQLLTFITQFSGVNAGDAAGTSLACPDLTGDGASDLVIGAPYATDGGKDSGSIYIHFGEVGKPDLGAGGNIKSFDVIYSGLTGTGLGTAMAEVPNFTGDIYHDLAIGAPQGDASGYGYVHVLAGKALDDWSTTGSIDAKAFQNLRSTYSDDYAGSALAGVGDINQDGFDDLVIGAPRFTPTIQATLAGQVYFVSGASSAVPANTLRNASFASLIGPQSDSELGISVAAAGDINGDNIPDVLITELRAGGNLSSEKGRVFVVTGGHDTWPTQSTITETDVVMGSFIGLNNEDRLGDGLGTAMDLDLDGRSEVFLAAPGATVLTSDGVYQAGTAYVVDIESIQDADNDGHTIQQGDCDDFEASVNPEQIDECDAKDNDCDGLVDEAFDLDGDGASDPDLCHLGTDCNDADPSQYPGAEELCDDEDQDCDKAIDEDFDHDHDGYLTPENCIFGNDCDDSRADVYPRAEEICDDVDQDCDEYIDEDFDDDNDGFFSNTGCENGLDCDDSNPAVYPDATEFCEGNDEDCDGSIDEGFDEDEDGHWPADLCTWGDDCDDSSSAINPEAEEVCDDLDNDCDMSIDETLMQTFYNDGDGDGYGGSTTSQACQLPPGYSTYPGDCNDDATDINPEAHEFCDSVDNDCDLAIDEGCAADTPSPKPLTPTPWPASPTPTATATDTSDLHSPTQQMESPTATTSSPGTQTPTTEETAEVTATSTQSETQATQTQAPATASQGTTAQETPEASPTQTQMPSESQGETATPSPTQWIKTPTQPEATDKDGDGYSAAQDCNDNDESIFPGAEEECSDTFDRDCDGIIASDCIKQPGFSCNSQSENTAPPPWLAAIAILMCYRRRS